MQIQQFVPDKTFRKVRNNIDRFFDKTLSDLIRGIRNNKENEGRYIASCIEEIKVELRQDSNFVKANAIEKLAYLQMLGYDISWASFNIIEVMASTKFSEKRVGYFAATQAFNDETDVLMLTTNLIRKDLLSSANIYDVGLALSGLSCFATSDLARDLVNDVVNLLSSSRPYVRKKALLLLYKLFLKYPEALRTMFTRLKERLEDQDPGVQSAAVNVVCELARKNPRNYLSLQNVFFKLLNTSSNNWMLIKIIKLFGSLVPFESKLGRRLLEPLTSLINSTSAMSLLYECINTVIAILISISSEGPGDYTPSIQLCVQKLGVLIEDSDQNLKYLGLLAMGKILQTHPKAVQAHKDIVLRCLDDKDESIRLRSLDLLYGMISKKNIMEIVRKLMEHLDHAEGSFYRDELLRRIVAICSHDGYKYITNFEWYISVLVELTKVEGTDHGVLIAEQIQDVAIRVQSVRHFAVSQMVLLVQNAQPLLQGNSTSQRANMAEVLLAAAWICGEYAQHVRDVDSLLESVLHLKPSAVPGALLSVFLQNALKLYVLQLCKLEADNDWERVESLDDLFCSRLPEFQYMDHLEAQERSCNFLALLKFASEKHSERVKVGATLAKCFEEELNPVAPKAQRRVPVPEGLNLDEWINEPGPLDSDEEEEEEAEGASGMDFSEEDEAVGRVLSPSIQSPTPITSHYGNENLPEHGRRKHSVADDSSRKESRNRSSPNAYNQPENGASSTSRHAHREPETVVKRRQFEQENNPFYVKDNPNKHSRSAKVASAFVPSPQKQLECQLQSPLEIAGVVGVDKYLKQRDSTLQWKNIEKEKRKNGAQQQMTKKSAKGKKRRNEKKRRGEEEEEEENEGIGDEEENQAGQQLSVYRGNGEMPEGALSSSEEEKLNDDFQALDIELDIELGEEEEKKKKKSSSNDTFNVSKRRRRQQQHKRKSSLEAIKSGPVTSTSTEDATKQQENAASNVLKKKKRKTTTTEQQHLKCSGKGQKFDAAAATNEVHLGDGGGGSTGEVEEETLQNEKSSKPVKTLKKKKRKSINDEKQEKNVLQKASRKKLTSSSRKGDSSIDSPTNSTVAANGGGDGQLISLTDDEAAVTEPSSGTSHEVQKL